MRFLFHFYDIHQRAGIQRAIVELSNAFVERGHEVILAVDTPRHRVAYALDDRVVVEVTSNPEPQKYGMRAWPVRIHWAIRALPLLRDLVLRHQPSVVVDHGTALGLIYPLGSFAGVPFVVQRHFPVTGFPHGKLLNWFSATLSRARTVVALTEATAQEMRSLGYCNVTVIPNMLPAGAKPAPYREAIPKTGLLMGRGNVPQKGFDLFLQALASIKMDGWHFQIVGPNVDSDPQLLALVDRYQLHSQVDLLPASADPYGLLRRSSCLIMPSLYEGFPFVALEALGVGRPVLGADVTGVRDLLIPGVNGVLFKPRDVASLAAALQDIESNPDQLSFLASNAASSVQQFRDRVVTAQWCALVAKLVEQPGPYSTLQDSAH